MSIMFHVTASASRQLEQFVQQHGRHLRLAIHPGGCSGFDIRFSEDDPRPDDVRFGPPGYELLVDPASLDHIKGATLDYAEAIGKEGFTVENIPNLESRCGCGSSFSLAD